MRSFRQILTGTALALAVNAAFAAGSPGEALAADGGKPLEQLPPEEARAVLVGAQAGVKLELPKVDISVKSISIEGRPNELRIVRPARAKV